jgi:hypothetical protein
MDIINILNGSACNPNKRSNKYYLVTILYTRPNLILLFSGIIGWVRNNRITVIFGIKIVVVYPNTNLLFRNSENSYYSIILW